MKNLVTNEPVMTVGLIVGAIMATLAMLVSLGVINIDPEQMSAIETALASILALVLPLIGAFVARSQVTPVANPHDNEGNPLTP